MTENMTKDDRKCEMCDKTIKTGDGIAVVGELSVCQECYDKYKKALSSET